MELVLLCLAAFLPLLCWIIYIRVKCFPDLAKPLVFAVLGMAAVLPASLLGALLFPDSKFHWIFVLIMEETCKLLFIALGITVFSLGKQPQRAVPLAVGATLAFAGFESLVYAAGTPVLVVFRAFSAVLFHGCTGVFCARSIVDGNIRGIKGYWPFLLGIALHALYNLFWRQSLGAVPLALVVLLIALVCARVLYSQCLSGENV